MTQGPVFITNWTIVTVAYVYTCLKYLFHTDLMASIFVIMLKGSNPLKLFS